MKNNGNIVETFHLEQSNLRGRFVRLDSVLDDILGRHDYPATVASLTAQGAVMALLLSSMLKSDGIFTLQAQGDGPVSRIVADVTGAGAVRACATFDAERLEKWEADEVPESAWMGLIGRGHLVFTVDQGAGTERYQGVVELNGGTLRECVQHYFAQSEQIATSIVLAVRRDDAGHWRGGAILLQKMPGAVKGVAATGDDDPDAWNRATTLQKSCTEAELLDTGLAANDLLYRLFHEEGVRAYDPEPVRDECRCSPDRAEGILKNMTSEERLELAQNDDHIQVKCEFCSREYRFDVSAFEHKINNPSGSIQ